ncbi:hypothetical protein D9611_005483 [Ephemerocybe angulata]|uniref:Uncharacterized protein n=1 Tax=Ephemerocybe angulata TaxID=980116 RepID=A0A8H5C1A6_9AGAR|nr:hypothetical protein D9611_005483 [Tulosesus angulatus]
MASSTAAAWCAEAGPVCQVPHRYGRASTPALPAKDIHLQSQTSGDVRPPGLPGLFNTRGHQTQTSSTKLQPSPSPSQACAALEDAIPDPRDQAHHQPAAFTFGDDKSPRRHLPSKHRP